MHIKLIVGLVVSSIAALGCTDEGEADSSGSGTGVGGASAGGNGTGAGTSEGGGGSGGEGGSGGSPGACLEAKVAAEFFTLNGDALCIVEVFTADGLLLGPYGTTPSWGSHGGPLTFASTSDTEVVISRWADTGAGVLTATDQEVTVAAAPAGAYWGPTAVEMTTAAGDGCDATNVVVAGFTEPDQDGALVTIDPEGASELSTAAGVFGFAASGTRLFYTGLAEVGAPNGNVGALYAADLQPCGGFESGGDVDVWGVYSGPVASDGLGNVFAVQTDAKAGTQELRGFADADVATGDPLTVGETLATLDGYGDAVAAIAPSGTSPGLVILQPNAGDMGHHQDVVSVAYTIDAGALVAGATTTLLELAQADDNLVLFRDDAGRIWVGGTRDNRGPVSTFFVLDRQPDR